MRAARRQSRDGESAEHHPEHPREAWDVHKLSKKVTGETKAESCDVSYTMISSLYSHSTYNSIWSLGVLEALDVLWGAQVQYSNARAFSSDMTMIRMFLRIRSIYIRGYKIHTTKNRHQGVRANKDYLGPNKAQFGSKSGGGVPLWVWLLLYFELYRANLASVLGNDSMVGVSIPYIHTYVLWV